MAFAPVPLFVGGGAEHDVNTLRQLAYYVTAGQEGVLESLDLRVLELSTPGDRVRVMPGGYVMRNRAAGGFQQSYMGRVPVETEVAIPASDASGTRTHLLVATVENPHISGEPYTNIDGPYARPKVISDVPPDTTSARQVVPDRESSFALARIEVPEQTATITDDMITDLRVVTNPYGIEPAPAVINKYYEVDVASPVPGQHYESIHCSSESLIAAGQTSWVDWPAEASWEVVVPDWATHVQLDIILNPGFSQGDVWGEMRLNLGGQLSNPTTFDVNYEADIWTMPMQSAVLVGGEMSIPLSLRGQKVTARLQGHMVAEGQPDHTGIVAAYQGTYVNARLDFKRRPAFT